MSAQANFFDQVTQYFNEAAKFTTYPDGLLEQIRVCNSVYRFDFPLRRAGGKIEVIPELRIAAFVNAIHKVARSYTELGIFP